MEGGGESDGEEDLDAPFTEIPEDGIRSSISSSLFLSLVAINKSLVVVLLYRFVQFFGPYCVSLSVTNHVNDPSLLPKVGRLFNFIYIERRSQKLIKLFHCNNIVLAWLS